jgi:hypothetical protein
MNNIDGQRILTDTAVLDERWSEAAHDLLREDWEVQAQADHYGLKIADSVVLGQLAVGNLREFVAWANDLDRQAVEVSDGDIANLHGADHVEATARRIAHHSGRTALSFVGSVADLKTHAIHYRQRVHRLRAEDNIGLFRLEAKDLDL